MFIHLWEARDFSRVRLHGELSYFFSRTTDKGETVGHIPASKSYIKYDNNRQPCIEVHQKNHKAPEFVNRLLFTNVFAYTQTDYYVIIVPEGTISTTDTYQIDLE